jgi:hypothetical protein
LPEFRALHELPVTSFFNFASKATALNRNES